MKALVPRRKVMRATLVVTVPLVIGATMAAATGPQPNEATGAPSELTQPYSPPLRQPPETQLLWGDLHLHTRLSMDAYIQGTRLLEQEDAYRFAMGETVIADNGVPARLRRPLDFLAVTDHSENMGLYVELKNGNPVVAGSAIGERWSRVLGMADEFGLRQAFGREIGANGPMPDLPSDLQQSIWQQVAETADRYNRPGRFTTLIGYEWTSMISGDNLHRVVLYRDGADRAGKDVPVNAQRDADPETLWDALERYERGGGQVLAIAHNGNLSNGRMFAAEKVDGSPLDRAYAERRMQWEPVYEVTQVKGDGETHPFLSPTDEFAAFERWDKTNVAYTTPKEDWMLRYEYARSALRDGLAYQQRLGANPFQFGMIGSTDSHTALSTTEEDNFFGKFKSSNPSASRLTTPSYDGTGGNWEFGASGLAAVWALENTREAIFDALRRKEVYATSGTRIRLRFFGGWQFAQRDIDRPDYARLGYRNGVPMGSTLPATTSAHAPTFLIHAAHDPDAANLDRVQVIKGWVDRTGETHERVYDVALSDGRKAGADGTIPPVGSTVDAARGSYRNSIGDPELATWWRDPDFDPRQPAFYYVRVLEIPTPRWTTIDAAFFGIARPQEAPAAIQERAYSSPIWYRP